MVFCIKILLENGVEVEVIYATIVNANSEGITRKIKYEIVMLKYVEMEPMEKCNKNKE